MANYTVYGYVMDNECNPIVGAKVYPYFKKIDSGSPDSKWSDTPYDTDSEGYYSFNLGDNVLLGSESSFKKGTDKIYIAIVSGGEQLLTSLDMDYCLFFNHLTTSNESNELNLNIESRRVPVIATHSFPNNIILTQTEYSMTETSYADTSWKNNGCYDVSISEKHIYDLVNIFDGHQLIDTVYMWGSVEKVATDNSNTKHIFDTAGIYDLSIRVREKWNTSTMVESQVTVKYNKPIPDFHWTPIETNNGKIKGQENITFVNDTADADGRSKTVYTYKWTIEDTEYDGSTDNSVIVDSVDKDNIPEHIFHSPGIKNIKLEVFWNDGFDDYTESITKQVTIYPFDILLDFTWSPEVPSNREQLVVFDPLSTTGDTDKILSYDWELEDWYPAPTAGLYTFSSDEQSIFSEGSPDNSTKVNNQYSILDTEKPEVRFHNNENKLAELTINYSNGWVDVSKPLEKIVKFSTYSLVANFDVNKNIVISRDDEITADNSTVDTHGIQYSVDWVFDDSFDLYNPNNPDYGISEPNNTSVMNGIDYDAQVSHFFQSNKNHSINMSLLYDNGWQSTRSESSDIITTVEYVISAEFTTLPLPDNSGFAGKIPVEYSNTTLDTNSRMIDVLWEWDDVDGLNNETSHITTREDIFPSDNQTFTFQYPSREPFSAVGGPIAQNINKDVYLSVRYDDGWQDQAFTDVSHSFEATPYEISSEIRYNCNTLNYTH